MSRASRRAAWIATVRFCLPIAPHPGRVGGCEKHRRLVDDRLEALDEAELFFGHGSDNAFDEAAYPTLPFIWLDTESGDQFVFMLRREDLP